jgi:MFS family permease
MAHLREELRRGWPIALVAAIAIGCGAGALPLYSLSLFVGPIQSDLGWSRAGISAAAAFLPAGFIIGAPVFGRLVDRFPVRRVATPSIVLMGLTLAAMAFIHTSVVWLYVGYGLVGILGMATTPVGYARIVTLWFRHNRGFGLGIMMLGTGVAALVTPLAVEAVISRFGWRIAWMAIGIWALAAAPLVWFVLREPPQEGVVKAKASALARGDESGLAFHEALKTWQFWFLALSAMVFMTPVGALLAHLVPLLTDRGLSRVQAVEIASVLGLGSIVARLVVGVLLDRVYPPALAALTLSSSAVGCLIIWYWPGASMAGAFLIGLSVGAEGNFMSYFASRYFGLRAFSEILGWFYTALSIGMVSGPILGSVLYSLFGDYQILLMVCGLMLLLSAALQGSLGRPPVFSNTPKSTHDEALQPRLSADHPVAESL